MLFLKYTHQCVVVSFFYSSSCGIALSSSSSNPELHHMTTTFLSKKRFLSLRLLWFFLLLISVFFIGMSSAGNHHHHQQDQPWAHFVGKHKDEVVESIRKENPAMNVQVVPKDSMVTMDFRPDRVRVFVDDNGHVVRAPTVG